MCPPPAYTNALVRRWGQRSYVARRKDWQGDSGKYSSLQAHIF